MAIGSSRWRDALDQRLRAVGQDIVTTRQTGPSTSQSVTCRAFVRTLLPQEDPRGLVPAQISGPLAQPDMRVVISGTELDEASWPLTDGYPLPIRSDKVTVAGKDRTIQLITPIFVADALARIDLTVRG